MDTDSRFCGHCGFDTQKVEEPKAENDNVTCGTCSYSFSRKSNFCPQCGATYLPCVFCGAALKKDASQCPVCKKELPKPCPNCGVLILDVNSKFCAKCGASLENKCSACGYKIEDTNTKFCPNCGNKIQA